MIYPNISIYETYDNSMVEFMMFLSSEVFMVPQNVENLFSTFDFCHQLVMLMILTKGNASGVMSQVQEDYIISP